MIDVMNVIWSKESDGSRRNNRHNVTVLKIKHMVLLWFSGRRQEALIQVHLNVDDTNNVVKHICGEQGRHDSAQDMIEDVNLSEEDLHKIVSCLRLKLRGKN